MRFFLLFLFFLLSRSLSSVAQIFGGNPPVLKFQQLNTDTVRVLFPASLEQEAREVVWIAHQLAKQSPASLGGRFRKWDVVLQNQTTLSNAYVGMAPNRSEFFMMPDLTNITINALPWHHTLAIHEFRHVEQFSNFDRHVPKLLGWIWGQQGKALGMNMVVPDWFWEGDAVWQETMITGQGRGRLPDFFNAYRALWLEEKHYSYQKLRNGSLRHFVPNHYHLGYLLVSYGRERYGLDFWNKVLDDALAFRGLLYPFQHAVKKQTGVRFPVFVAEAFQWFQQRMSIQNQSLYGSSHPLTALPKHNTAFYQFPQMIAADSLIVLKTAYNQIPTWVVSDTSGRTKKMKVKDIAYDDYYTVKNGKVVYTSWRPDLRWGWKEYSEIRVLDVATRHVQKITNKSRLFMPDWSPDMQLVVAVRQNTNQQIALELIEVKTGKSRTLPNREQYIYTYPRFNQDGTCIISAVRNRKGAMTLLRTNITTGEETVLFPFINAPLAYVKVVGERILFTAAQPGADQLFCFDQQTGRFQKWSELPNGTYQAIADTTLQTLFFNTFTSSGSRLMQSKIPSATVPATDSLRPLADLYLSRESFSQPDLLAGIQSYSGPVTRYKNGNHLFNLHSWRPLLNEPDYGMTFYSDNVLNTFSGAYGYYYNRNESFHRAKADLIYGGWYPVLNLGIEQTWHRSTRTETNRLETWNQFNANAGVTLPLNLSGGRHFRKLTLAAFYNTEQLQFTGASKDRYSNSRFQYVSSSVRWSSQIQKARQHIVPRFAQVFQWQYRTAVGGVQGNQMLTQAGLYFPGLFMNHHVVLLASVASRDTFRGSWFANNFPFARGYNGLNFPRMKRVSFNYHFPVLYPDFGLFQLLYIQRIRGNSFFDYTRIKSLRTGRQFDFRSAGLELFFDSRVWNSIPVTWGLRYSRLLDTDFVETGRNPNRFEVIVPLDLF